jgi:RsiW-degrading membrane proteinase PrsW (M82 family)
MFLVISCILVGIMGFYVKLGNTCLVACSTCTFVFLLLLNTPWSYTQVISDIAKNSIQNKTENIILFCLFFIAVIAAGFYLNSFKPTSIKIKTILNCFFGGAIIGWGSQLIIGSHDSITLYGFPLLLASAAIAMFINLITLAVCIKFIG